MLLPLHAGSQTPRRNSQTRAVLRENIVYEKRFAIPEITPEVLLKLSSPPGQSALQKPATQPQETEIVNDIYFDDSRKTLAGRHSYLRHRTIFTGGKQKQIIQLVSPYKNQSNFYRVLEFKVNKKPDKGTGFTTHPLRKLLEKKDRPVIDSLLNTMGTRTESLKPLQEILQNARDIPLQNQAESLLKLTHTEVRQSAPDVAFQEIAVSAEIPAKGITPEQLMKIQAAAKIQENQLKTKFPEIRPERQSRQEKITGYQQGQSGLKYLKLILILVAAGIFLSMYFIRKKKAFPA